MITLTETKPVSTEDLVHAIELVCSPVLGSLNMANALGGSQSDTWRLVREFTLVQLIDEVCERGVDLTTMRWRGSSFMMSEFVFGTITTKYSHVGDRAYCEFVDATKEI